MRDEFPGWYAKPAAELEALWDKAIFVPDTNILLHCLRHRAEVRDDLIRVLEVLKDRLWIPYQVGLEFQKNRLDVEFGAVEAYEKLSKDYAALIVQMKERLKSLRAHPTIVVEDEVQELDNFTSACDARIAKARAAHPTEKLREATERLTALFAGRVGPMWPSDRLAALRKEGEDRYNRKLPPGYKDAKKDEDPNAKFGDLIIWKDMIAKAQSEKKPVIFISDDAKEDWWRIHKGKKIGIRPELVEEFSRESDQQFYMYELSQFLRIAAKRYEEIPDQNVDMIEKSLSEDDQARRIIANSVEIDELRRNVTALEIERARLISFLAGVPTLDDHGVDETVDRSTIRARLTNLSAELLTLRTELDSAEQQAD